MDLQPQSSPNLGQKQLDFSKITKLTQFGYPEEYVMTAMKQMQPNYCTAGYYLLEMDQNYCWSNVKSLFKIRVEYAVKNKFTFLREIIFYFHISPFFQGDFKAALQEWREEYGDVVGIKLGSELAVVLSNYDTVST